MLDTLAMCHPHGDARRGLSGKGLHDGGLPDTRLSGHQHHLPGPLLRVPQGPLELLEHRLSRDKQWRGPAGGRRTKCTGGGGVGHRHRRQEAVTAARHGGNVPRRLCRIAQHLAHRANGDAHHGISDGRLRPDGIQQFGFRHEAAGVGHQVLQHGKGFGRQYEDVLPTPQAGIGRVKPEGTKVPLYDGHGTFSTGKADEQLGGRSGIGLHAVTALGRCTAAFYTIFTVSLHHFYGSVYGAFMTFRARGVMLARVLREASGGALPGSAGFGMRQVLIYGPDDQIVPLVVSQHDRQRAQAAGDHHVQLKKSYHADHFDVIDPSSPQWPQVIEQIIELVQ